jgi:hypothetical protein
MLKQAQVRIVRFPASTTSVPEAKVVSAASAVQQVGAVPVVVLPATTSNDAASKATIMVKDMNRIFGQTTVYYEYGNEDDIAGTSATQYSTAWNAQVPALKQLATPMASFSDLSPTSMIKRIWPPFCRRLSRIPMRSAGMNIPVMPVRQRARAWRILRTGASISVVRVARCKPRSRQVFPL